MDFDKLNTFYLVANSNSLTDAAKQLGMSKSTISRQLLLLEEQLNVQLFSRNSNKMVLSPDGEILKSRAQNILMEVEATKSTFANASKNITGSLKIATTHALAGLWLTKFLHRFIEQNPNLELSIIASSEELNLSLRQADVAIRPYVPNCDELIQTHLMRWRLYLFASKSYLERFGHPQKTEDLDKHRLLILEDSPSLYPNAYTHWPLIMGTRLGVTRKPFLTINSVQGMFNLAVEGVGIGNFSPTSPLFITPESRELVPILPDKIFSDIDVYYIYPKQYQNLKKVQLLGAFLKNEALN